MNKFCMQRIVQSIVVFCFILGASASAGAISISSFGGNPGTSPQSITSGIDNNTWFVLKGTNSIGRLAPGIGFTSYLVPTANAFVSGVAPSGIVSGPDGALWFTETGANKIGRIATDTLAITEYPITSPSSAPVGILSGPDGALWFTESNTNKIGRITTGGTVSEFTIPTTNSGPQGIALGSDGALWFTETSSDKIGRITTAGAITEFQIPTANSLPFVITAGPDGAMWFTEKTASQIGRITTGAGPAITEFATPAANSAPIGIETGTDGLIYFTEFNTQRIGQITPGASPTINEYIIHQGGNPIGMSSVADGMIDFTVVDAPSLNLDEVDEIVLPTDYVMVSLSGDGQGVVTSNKTSILNQPAISCDDTGQYCSGSFAQGQIVTLTAAPFGNSVFRGWSGGTCGGTVSSCVISVPATESAVTATFSQKSSVALLSVGISGAGTGSVTSSQSVPWGLSCGSACNDYFDVNSTVTLNATPASGSFFVGWSGGGCTGTGACAITMTANTTVTANFGPVEILSVTRSGNGGGTVTSDISGISCGVTCNFSYPQNTIVTLTATPTSGSTFVGWSGSGCAGVKTCSVTLSQATTINAQFISDTNSDITLVSALLPASRSVKVGNAATFFGTIINASSDITGNNCTISPTTNIPASFSFQTTDSATNAPIGTANTPVSIAPGGAQSFILALTPSSALAPTNVAFSFTCTNSTAAASNIGLNTLLLSASVTPTPDIVALAATVGNTGIVNIPGPSGAGAFAVATVNVGAAGTIVASANSGSGNLPVTVTICQTNPSSGQCLSAPTGSVQATINANDTPTFAVFVQGGGTVPFQPAVNRIFVQFEDAGNVMRGSTSVAVRTQ